MTPEEADRRIAAQASDDERLALADVVINTNGSMQETLTQADALWTALLEKSRSGLGGRNVSGGA
jgi:dephospho-CoA kinase